MLKVIGRKWLVTFNRLGMIEKVALSEELSQLLTDDPAVQPLAATFSESGLRRMTEQSIITLPDRPVEQGDRWEQTVAYPLAEGELTTKRICRYVGPDDEGLERIAVTMTATFQPQKEMRLPVELTKHDGRGEVLFDPRQGRVVRSRFTQNLELHMGPADRLTVQKLKLVSELGAGTADRTADASRS